MKKNILKRNIISSLILLTILLGLGYYVYNRAEEDALSQKTNLSFIPSNNTFVIVEVENISEEIQKIFSSNLIWAEFTTQDSLFGKFETKVNQYDSLLDTKKGKPKAPTEH